MALKPKLKTLAVLLLGVLIGAVLGSIHIGRQMREFMKNSAEASLIEKVIDARQIASGQADAVLKRKNEAIPDMVLMIEKVYAPSPEERIPLLRSVERYYRDNPSLPLPAELKALFDSLPPRVARIDVTVKDREVTLAGQITEGGFRYSRPPAEFEILDAAGRRVDFATVEYT